MHCPTPGNLRSCALSHSREPAVLCTVPRQGTCGSVDCPTQPLAIVHRLLPTCLFEQAPSQLPAQGQRYEPLKKTAWLSCRRCKVMAWYKEVWCLSHNQWNELLYGRAIVLSCGKNQVSLWNPVQEIEDSICHLWLAWPQADYFSYWYLDLPSTIILLCFLFALTTWKSRCYFFFFTQRTCVLGKNNSYSYL